VVLNHDKHGKHLLLDGVDTYIYKNRYLHSIATIPGYAFKQAEDIIFMRTEPRHRRSPSPMEKHMFWCPLPLRMGARVNGLGFRVYSWSPRSVFLIGASPPIDGT